jgi:hypothetical protein
MAWIITRDLLSERYDDWNSAKGVGSEDKDKTQKTEENKFILKDDDGNSYYHGYCDSEFTSVFDPLDWAMGVAGCTSISYKIDGKFQMI